MFTWGWFMPPSFIRRWMLNSHWKPATQMQFRPPENPLKSQRRRMAIVTMGPEHYHLSAVTVFVVKRNSLQWNRQNLITFLGVFGLGCDFGFFSRKVGDHEMFWFSSFIIWLNYLKNIRWWSPFLSEVRSLRSFEKKRFWIINLINLM